MVIVYDRENGLAMGPFPTRAEAERWLEVTGKYEGWTDPKTWAEIVELGDPGLWGGPDPK